MLEILRDNTYVNGEITGIEKYFIIDGIEGKYLYEENWYNPLEYHFMEIRWNNITIINNYGYWIKGDTSNNAIIEISDTFDSSIKEVIENGNYNKF